MLASFAWHLGLLQALCPSSWSDAKQCHHRHCPFVVFFTCLMLSTLRILTHDKAAQRADRVRDLHCMTSGQLRGSVSGKIPSVLPPPPGPTAPVLVSPSGILNGSPSPGLPACPTPVSQARTGPTPARAALPAPFSPHFPTRVPLLIFPQWLFYLPLALPFLLTEKLTFIH